MAELSPIEQMVTTLLMGPVPHHRALGFTLVACEAGKVGVRLPYAEALIGDPSTRVLHGGAVTTLLDATCGAAAFSALRKPGRVATLDLRIDYLRAARPDRDVIAHAECYRVTHHVAFVRATAHDGDADDPVATAAATFAIFPRSPKGTP